MLLLKQWNGAGASLVLIALSLAMAMRCSILDANVPTHPSDQDLEGNLRQHEAEFESLIRMYKIDSRIIRIADDFTWLDTNVNWPRPESEIGFSRERWDEYRHVFKVLGLKKGLLKPEDTDTIYLIASSAGSVSSGSAKGYAYSVKPLSPLSDSLDHISPELRSQRSIYKKLGDNWYLFYQSD